MKWLVNEKLGVPTEPSPESLESGA